MADRTPVLQLFLSPNVYDMRLEHGPDSLLIPTSRIEVVADVRQGNQVVAYIPMDLVELVGPGMPLLRPDTQSHLKREAWFRHGDEHDDPGGPCAKCDRLDR